MKLKTKLRILFHLFCAITTALVLFIAIEDLIHFHALALDGWFLLKLVSVSFASTLPTLFLLGQDNVTRWIRMLLLALHFILTSGAVFGLLILYEWIDAENALYTVLFFLVIYVTAYVGLEIRSRRLAAKLNERINAFRNADNETHDD